MIKVNDIKSIAIAGSLIAGVYVLRSLVRNDADRFMEQNIQVKNLTYPLAYYYELADALEAFFWEYWYFEWDEAAADALMTLWTDDDYFQTVLAYGARCRPKFICEKKRLTQSIIQLLDQEFKEEVNAVWAERGMSIRV